MRTLFLVNLLLLLSVSTARGEDWAPTGLFATWENDIFGGTDRHYTNGAELGLTGRVPRGGLRFYLGDDGGEWRLSVAQRIYTPERLDARDLVTDDRPYAGWLRLGLWVSKRSACWPSTSRIGIELGVLGPASGAETAQELFHGTLTGSSPPRGWRNQLGTEVGVRFSYEYALRAWRGEIIGLDYELEPSAAVSFGNVTIDASLGAHLRVGRVPDRYTLPEPSGFHAFLTLGGQVRLAGFDVFLDGSLLSPGGPRVHRRYAVVDVEVGMTVQLRGCLSLSYTHTVRSPQFAGQGGWDQFGSLSLTWSW